MVTGKNQQRIYAPIPYVRQHLPDCVGSTLEPLWTFRRLLGRKDLDKAIRNPEKR